MDAKEPAILKADLLHLADQHYPEEMHETDDQKLFALLCDLTVIYAAECDSKLVTSVSERDCALVIGPLIANVCPGYTLTDDVIVSEPPPDLFEVVEYCQVTEGMRWCDLLDKHEGDHHFVNE